MKTALFMIFIVLNLLVFIVTQYNINQRIDSAFHTHLNNLKIHYNLFMKAQKDSADIIYDMTLKDKRVINLLSQASFSKDELKRDAIRTQLAKELQGEYEFLKEKGVLQFHFVFPDNKSFLRMHKLNKYGDDLSNIRLDFAKINKEHSVVRGFAQGRTSHSMRNVYPLYNEKKEYIGAMEISYPTELLQKDLNEVSKIHSHFLVKKSVFDSKAWLRDDLILQYRSSMEHKDYLMTFSQLHVDDDMLIKSIVKLQKKISENISKEKEFSLLLKDEMKVKVASFFPVTQNVTKKTVAWIVSYEDNAFISTSLRDMLIIRVVVFFILAVLMLFAYRLISQKKILKNLLESYDKNVMSSRTNAEGLYTHVSKAFCKISGYTKDELIGKESIVKNLLLEDKFKKMKDSLSSGNIWKSEIKDKKKNGDFYWVSLEIEPILEENKIVGFSSIRQDITDKKDVENIQKEIIFTMGTIGESRSKETANHVKRVALYSKVLAKYYGLNQADIDILEQASPMHDIGKVSIPDSILNKPGKLNEEERSIIITHAEKGYNMLKSSNRQLLQAAATVAYEHHEKWDGTGYPRGLKEHDIHIYSRITALADVFDALGSKRCYKEAWKDEDIFALLKQERAKHFDPELVDIFFEHLEEFLVIRKILQD